MKVLGLVHSREKHLADGSLTGADASAKGFFEQLGKLGHEIIVKGCKLSRQETYRSALWSLLRYQRRDRLFITENLFARTLKTRRAAHYVAQYAHEIDLVIVNSSLFMPFIAKAIKPYVVHTDYNYTLRYTHPHYVPPPVWHNETQKRAILDDEKLLYQQALHTFVPTEHIRRSIIQDYDIAPEKVTAVGRGTPVEIPQPMPLHDFQKKRFIFIGEPKSYERKGVPVLLEAFARLHQAYPDATLTVIGPTTDMIGEHPGVWALGMTSRERLKDLLMEHSCFVFPTRQEPFGLAITEAMAYGLPTIVTNVDSLPELVLDHQTGIVIPPNDAAQLAAAMQYMVTHPHEAACMGEAGYQRITAGFTWEKVAHRVNNVLNSLENVKNV